MNANKNIGIRVAGLSTTGVSHLRSGLPCQDSCGWLAADDMIAVAVSDGAGTASHSQLGSAVAVRAAVASLLRDLSAGEDLTDSALALHLQRALQASKIAVEEEALSINAHIGDLACTLLIAIGTKGGTIGAAQIGDGAIIIADISGNIASLTTPASGEHLNETTFITSPSACETAQIRTCRGITHFAVLTDGLQMISLKMPTAAPHPQFFRPFFRLVSSASEENTQAAIESFLVEKRVTDRTDDDLTLVVASLDP